MHCGSGSELGIIDLPIQREKHTDYPKIEGSSLKGAIREAVENINENDSAFQADIHYYFGYDDKSISVKNGTVSEFFDEKEKQEFQGAIGVSDSRILFFPVKSMKGVFAYITCPDVLNKFIKALYLCRIPSKIIIPNVPIGECLVSDKSLLTLGENIVLEEYAFKINKQNNFEINIASLKQILNKVAILNDDDFNDFVNLSTEVITRTKIDNESGTVEDGALFTEEYLPAESIMYSLIFTGETFGKPDKTNSKPFEFFKNCIQNDLNDIIQIGGNANIGKGISELNILEMEGK